MTVSMPVQKPGRSEQTVETPAEFLKAVQVRFGHLHWDLAATPENTKAPQFFTSEQDSLKQDWQKCKGNLWCNPPFGHLMPWVKKAEESVASRSQGSLMAVPNKILMLLPAAIGAKWFALHCHGSAMVLGLTGRLTFVGHTSQYPKDLMLCVWSKNTSPRFGLWDWRQPWNGVSV
jgi:phage N-6-adenine-methyltransferase